MAQLLNCYDNKNNGMGIVGSTPAGSVGWRAMGMTSGNQNERTTQEIDALDDKRIRVVQREHWSPPCE